jgi:TM2 domain-containing membrane protein YozV
VNEPKDKTVAYAFWLAGCFGLAGLQRFYLGRYTSGFLYLFTWGFFGFAQVVDLLLISDMVDSENLKGMALQGGYHPNLPAPNVPALLVDRPTDQKAEAIHVTILRICRDRQGATLSDCIIETGAEITEVKNTVKQLIQQELLHIYNRESDGSVVYIAV